MVISLVAQVSALRRVNVPLYILVLLCLLMVVLTTAGILLDPRYVGGAPVWLKPLKFAISTVAYALSILWTLSFLEGKEKFVRVMGFWLVSVLVLELGLIALQAARGVVSHFNMSTPLDGAIYSTMGIAISSLSFAHLLVAVLVLRQKFTNPVLAASLRWGMLLSFLGMLLAILMTVPTQGQMTALQAGGVLSAIGAHGVGVPDGSAGLPVVGWSTRGGDLRIGHFVGLHALQILPLLGWLLTQSKLLERQKRGLLALGGLAYLALTLLLTYQALRGESVVQPGTLSLTLLSSVLLVLTAGALWTLRRPTLQRRGAVR